MKVVTLLEKLRNRINKELPKKTLIGDININDAEFAFLIDYFKRRFKMMTTSDLRCISDPLLAVALVQIGIKYYDGNYWSHVDDILGIKLNPSTHRRWLGESFILTLKKNGKYIFDETEKVNSILFHCFVSDYYSRGLFEFLFDYYRIDLERDLTRNTKDAMLALMETIKRKSELSDREADNEIYGNASSRAYRLRKHTLIAIGAFPIPGRVKMRRMLRLIDRCFWEQLKPKNPVSRLTKRFNEWQDESDSFKSEYERTYRSGGYSNGRKRFSSPYIFCSLREVCFNLILPAQLIKEEDYPGLVWEVCTDKQAYTIDAITYQAVTSLKTEKAEMPIDHAELFGEITVVLKNYDRIVRKFPKIEPDNIRFFDKDGDFSYKLILGEMYAFTKINETPISAALIDNEPVGAFVRSYFDFQEGDLVILPGNKSMAVGESYSEGLMQRGLMKNSYVYKETEEIQIFNNPPTLLLTIAASRLAGTSVEINNKRYNLLDNRVTLFDILNRSDNKGILLYLDEWECEKDGIYQIVVDVPNDRKIRNWKYALINGFSIEFEDAPYIFEQRATITFSESHKVKPLTDDIESIRGENSFNFSISENDYIVFEVETNEYSLKIYTIVPVLKWSLDNELWRIMEPKDIWHTDFPNKVYFKFPENKLRLSMDESIEDYVENEDEIRERVYDKNKTLGIFECDLTRFKSWLDRDRIVHYVYFSSGSRIKPFMKVFSKSVISNYLIKADFNQNILIGEFDIIGQAEYFVDITFLHDRTNIAIKQPIINGRVESICDLRSGLYQIVIFEVDQDESGFGGIVYLPLDTYEQDLINPNDLSGKSLNLRCIKKMSDNNVNLLFNTDYSIANLRKIDNNSYTGQMNILTPFGGRPAPFKVRIEFPDLNNLTRIVVAFWDDEEEGWLEFLYDSKWRAIVKKEDAKLRRGEKYRRYSVIYPDEFIYYVTIN